MQYWGEVKSPKFIWYV